MTKLKITKTLNKLFIPFVTALLSAFFTVGFFIFQQNTEFNFWIKKDSLDRLNQNRQSQRQSFFEFTTVYIEYESCINNKSVQRFSIQNKAQQNKVELIEYLNESDSSIVDSFVDTDCNTESKNFKISTEIFNVKTDFLYELQTSELYVEMLKLYMKIIDINSNIDSAEFIKTTSNLDNKIRSISENFD